MVEATLPSSYTNLFYIQLQILDDDFTPTKNSPGSNIGLLYGHKQFPRLVPETSKQISAQNNTYGCSYACSAFRQLLWPTVADSKNSTSMTTRWHFDTTRWHYDRTVTQREILERNRHHKHLFVIWSTLKTDGFWHVFGSMGFLQLEEEKFVFWKYFSPGISSSQDKGKKGIRIGISPNRD